MDGWMDWRIKWDKVDFSFRCIQNSVVVLEVTQCDLFCFGLRMGKLQYEVFLFGFGFGFLGMGECGRFGVQWQVRVLLVYGWRWLRVRGVFLVVLILVLIWGCCRSGQIFVVGVFEAFTFIFWFTIFVVLIVLSTLRLFVSRFQRRGEGLAYSLLLFQWMF